MWQTPFPTLTFLEIIVTIKNELPIKRIKIYNFNKSLNVSILLKDLSKLGKYERSQRN